MACFERNPVCNINLVTTKSTTAITFTFKGFSRRFYPKLEVRSRGSHHSHAALQLRAGLLVHLDEPGAVVDEHAVQVTVLDVHPEDEAQLLGLLQRSAGGGGRYTPGWTMWSTQLKRYRSLTDSR